MNEREATTRSARNRLARTPGHQSSWPRLALVGDITHVPTPMTRSGFSMSAQDAETVAEAVAAGVNGTARAHALKRYEQARLGRVRTSGKPFFRRPGRLSLRPCTATALTPESEARKGPR
ncbi:FAD-dependent monooxygenase [Streptomyces sp. NPDC060209]|uniref:FAD-dependent monooxygenase n=1 Tax=Streptomyces sp. NPDC060209 TaxID=3347073 RepID=UPI00365F0251